jgi:hypothetical protein
MRRLSRQITILAVLLCLVPIARASAQTYGAPGMFSGVGLSLMPGTSVAPKAEMRLDLSRLQYLRSSGMGSNNVVLGAGMSSNLDVYIRLVGEQVGAISSATSMAYGAKLLLPFRLPAVREAALWFEAASSEGGDRTALFSMELTRVAIVAKTGPNGSHALILAGAAIGEESSSVMAGLGWVLPLSHAAVVSPEAIYGYFGNDGYALFLNGALRVLPTISLQVNPGYCRSRGLESALLTVGLSISTAAFDFGARAEEKQLREGFTLPTIEEMERGEAKPEKPKDAPGGADKDDNDGQASLEIMRQGDTHR